MALAVATGIAASLPRGAWAKLRMAHVAGTYADDSFTSKDTLHCGGKNSKRIYRFVAFSKVFTKYEIRLRTKKIFPGILHRRSDQRFGLFVRDDNRGWSTNDLRVRGPANALALFCTNRRIAITYET